MAEKPTRTKDVLISAAISTIFSIVAAIVILGINKTDQAAPRDYVDKRFEKIEYKLDQKADKNDIIEIKATLSTIDARLYDLWSTSQTKKQTVYFLPLLLFGINKRKSNYHRKNNNCA